MAKDEPSGLESGNRSIASLETQVVRRRWIPVQIGLHEAAALRPWMLVPEQLVALVAGVRLTYIMIIHVNLQFLYRRLNQYKRKLVSGICIIKKYVIYMTV
ncbi:Hypothetical_protein [Hexamita inflata]|uniref:Hypothetical_protein n=1 Tax=Hexamita inflata TaxID=28002 RepID=A0ABP1KJ03_9EUKA